MTDAREAGLPRWAREIINSLREQLRCATEPMVTELAKLRPQLELHRARESAMTELLECAARGGHKTAYEIVEIIRAYDLTLTEMEE